MKNRIGKLVSEAVRTKHSIRSDREKRNEKREEREREGEKKRASFLVSTIKLVKSDMEDDNLW
jgi:hypothetical protein